MKSQPHKYDKFAIAIKTGRDIIKERSPILFKTFLSKVDNKILISESPHDPIENVPVIDVFSNLYDGLKDKAGHDLQFIPYSTVNSEKTNHNDLHVKQLEPNESSLGWISDAHKNLPGFRELWERFPKQEWFLMIDDDTYVFMDNLNNFVADYNSSEPFYFGAGNTFVGCDGVKSHADSTMIAHGGSGILISRGAMQRLKFVWDICITKYRGKNEK